MTNPTPRLLLIDATGIIQHYEMHPLAALVLPEMPIQILISVALCTPTGTDSETIIPLLEKIFDPSHPVFYHLNDFDLLIETITTDIDTLVDKYATVLGYSTDIPLILHRWVNNFTIALSYYEQRIDHQTVFERSTRGMLGYHPSLGMEQFPYQSLSGS